MIDGSNNSFVCPNDRQLQLRAKLNSGWSFHTNKSTQNNRSNTTPVKQTVTQPLRDEELERIKKVLERAQRIDLLEQQRIGKLVDRFENIKKHATGNGSTQCVLCADSFGMLGASSVICVDCQKSVCNKCSIETIFNQQVITLCKICSENRELWKKSGAWFFRTLPTRASLTSDVKPSASIFSAVTAKSDSVSSIGDQSSSDDQISTNSRMNQQSSPITALNNNHFSSGGNTSHQTHESTNSITDHEESLDSFKTDERSCKELSIDEYIPKVQPIQSPVSSTHTNLTSSSSNLRPTTSMIINTSSPVDDCGFGTLDFEIIWNESLNVLTISLIRARNLRSCDSNGLSDPYVKLHIVPGVAKATKLRSHTIRRTLNPDFDETLVYNGISLDDMKSKTLKFSVYDEDSVGSDFLGEYRLKLSTIRADAKEAYSVFLQNKTEFPTDEDKNERGKLLISLMYSKITSTLHLKIIRGCQLLPMDFGQTSDPYCKIVLFPLNDSNTKWNFKTSVKKHTLQPEFNEEFTFHNVQLQELISKTLQITVFDKDMGKKDDYIGGFQLGQTSSGDDLRHWLLMVKSPEHWIDMWHKLQPEQYSSPLRQRDSQTSR